MIPHEYLSSAKTLDGNRAGCRTGCRAGELEVAESVLTALQTAARGTGALNSALIPGQDPHKQLMKIDLGEHTFLSPKFDSENNALELIMALAAASW